MLKKIGSLLFFLTYIFAQNISVKAYADPVQVEIGEEFSYALEISGIRELLNITLPQFKDITLLSNRASTSQSMRMINGNVSVSVVYSYFMKANKEGDIIIPSVMLNYQGKQFSSNPVTIKVAKASVTNTQKDFFLKMDISNSKPFINEEITATTLLYVRSGIQLNNLSVAKTPSVNNVWKESYETGNNVRHLKNESINGQVYSVFFLSKDAFFPSFSGKVTLESIELNVSAVKPKQQRRRSNDPFDSFFGFQQNEMVQVTVPAIKRSIDVQNFPDNIEAHFLGFSGQLKLAITIDKKELKTNEPAKLTVSLSGSGNIETLQIKKFFISPDIEQYEPTIKSSIQRKNDPISGRKSFEFALVPRVAGNHKIGPFRFSYFNMKSKKIEILEAEEISLDVAEGKSFANAENTNNPSIIRKNIKTLDEDIRYIRNQSEGFRKMGSHLMYSALYLSSFPAIFIILFVGHMYLKQKNFLDSNLDLKRQKEAASKSSKILKDAIRLKSEGKSAEFFNAIHYALIGYIADKNSVSADGLTYEHAENLMKKRAIDTDTIRLFKTILENCDFYRYSSVSNPQEVMDKMIAESNDLLNKLTKVF